MNFFRAFVRPRTSWGWFWFIITLLSVVSWLPASFRSGAGALWSVLALAALAAPLFLSEVWTFRLEMWPPFLRALALAPFVFLLALTVGVAPECRHPGVIVDFVLLRNGATILWPHYIAFAAAFFMARRQFPLEEQKMPGGTEAPPPESERVMRSRTLITEAEAQRRLRDVLGGAIVSTVRFGVLEIPDLLATQHFLLLGTTGSGKTTLLQMMLNSVLPGLKPGSNRRALIYDAKRDVLSFLANFSVPVKTLHPYHREGVAWDIAADVRDDELIGEIADIFVPQQNQTQPVFSEGARALLAGVMQSFVELAPDPKKPAWTLRDVMLATRYRRRMEIILNATTRARHLVEKFLDKSDFTRSLDSSLTIALRRLGYVAAAWDAATEKVSLVEWASSESVLVLGSDPTREGTLRQLNSVILKRLSQLLLHKDEAIRQPGRTWIFVDELIRAGKLEGLGDLLHEGRSKGVAVCVGFQDLPGLYAEFGEHEGRSIVSQCSHKLFLKAGDPVTAEYAADQLSEQEIERVRVSQNQGASRGTTRSGMHDRSESDQHSRGYSTSRETEKRHVVMPGEILGLPLGDWQRGIDGYYDCPAVGEPFRGHVSPALIAQTPKPKKEVANFDERKPGPLREWDQKDLARLGLSKYPELLGGPPPGQASSSGWDKIGL